MLLLVFSLVSFLFFASFMRRPSAVPSSATGWSSTLPSSNPSTRPFPKSRSSTNLPVCGLPADLVAPVGAYHLGSPPPRSRATTSPRTGRASCLAAWTGILPRSPARAASSSSSSWAACA
ncbi:hypothetical protein PF008_g30824 [Phytophthora fragariae]|uniref:Secreted protein n=1 Tax=Phytophthora fragariae TaxID=53985 RepID=A0A6G0Q536_9STRA|nr:hypothetical protein PF008_g30824 [Phytophthora fragariae]